ncbi:outer membrane beta-barrel protein [candidate division KSB1 bacterium]|nr:outer membrane beta-barrel protein [candidate division KSB1 bacterium]
MQGLCKQLIIFIGCSFFLVPAASGQSVGDWAISASATLSQPAGGLADWFQPTTSAEVSAGQQYNDNWFIEGLVSFSRYDRENLSGYPAGKLELMLDHYEVLVSGRYGFASRGMLRPYLNIAGGLCHWKGTRGEVQADSSVIPFVPPVAETTRSETNWSFRSGIGIEMHLSSSLAVDMLGYYRFIVADLWPTLQPNIELEGVSGLQSLNLAVGIRYYF